MNIYEIKLKPAQIRVLSNSIDPKSVTKMLEDGEMWQNIK